MTRLHCPTCSGFDATCAVCDPSRWEILRLKAERDTLKTERDALKADIDAACAALADVATLYLRPKDTQ